MAKPKKSRCSPKKMDKATVISSPENNMLPSLQEDLNLWYKIRVLIYDLRNLAKDPTSEQRTLATTDELYISSPYFTPAEAARIKATIVDVVDNDTPSDFEDTEHRDTPPNLSKTTDTADVANTQTVEEAIKARLANFFEKRRASGDSRPCGPHDMAPIYQRVFGIEKAELEDERFLNRLRRSGLTS